MSILVLRVNCYVALFLSFSHGMAQNVTFIISTDKAGLMGCGVILSCSWTSGHDTKRITIYKLKPSKGCLVKVRLPTPQSDVDVVKCEGDHWDRERMEVQVAAQSVRVSIKDLRCEDKGMYSCKANSDESEMEAELAGPDLSAPIVDGYPPYYSERLTFGRSVTFICSAYVGNEDSKELYWILEGGQNYWQEFGTSGNNTQVLKYRLGCTTLAKSTLTLFDNDIDLEKAEYPRALCKVVINGTMTATNESTVECGKGDLCSSSKPIKFFVDEANRCDPSMEPASLANTTIIEPNSPMRLKCDADLVSLDSSYRVVDQVRLGRSRPQSKWGEECIVSFYPEARDPAGRQVFDVPAGRDWVVEFTYGPLNTSRERSVHLTITDTTFDDAGLYYCTVIYEKYKDFNASITRCQVLELPIFPQKPTMHLKFKKLPLTGMYEVMANCCAYVGRNGKLTWYLRSQNDAVEAMWPLYGYGWPKSIRLPLGIATVEEVSESWVKGTMISATLKLSTMHRAKLGDLRLSCTSQDMTGHELTNQSLWISSGLKPPDFNYGDDDYHSDEGDSDYKMLAVMGIISAVVGTIVFIAVVDVWCAKNGHYSFGSRLGEDFGEDVREGEYHLPFVDIQEAETVVNNKASTSV